jgi:amino acid transporter
MKSTSGTLGLFMAVIVGLNAVIGAGIFTAPAVLQTQAGAIGLISYLFVIAAVLFMALALAKVAELYPRDSIFYSYPKLWAGEWGGIAATLLYVGGLTVALGLLAQIAGSYLALYFPLCGPQAWGGILIGVLTLLCLAGNRATAASQVILVVLTILPIVLITALCFTKARFSNLTPLAPFGFGGAFIAIKTVVFGFFGFEAIPSLFTSIKDPQKNIPRAIIATIVITGVVYFVFTAAVMLALPRALFSSSATPLSAALLAEFPAHRWLVSGIHWSIIITIVGTIHAMLLAISSLVADTSGRMALRMGRLSRMSALILMGFLSLVSTFSFTSISLMFSAYFYLRAFWGFWSLRLFLNLQQIAMLELT